MTNRHSSSRARWLGVLFNLVVILSLLSGPVGLRSSAAPAPRDASIPSAGGGDLLLPAVSSPPLPAAEASVVTTAPIVPALTVTSTETLTPTATATAVPTVTVPVTPTMPPTDGPLPTPTATPLPTPTTVVTPVLTVTPSPAPTATPLPAPALSLSMTALPTTAGPGEVVTFTLAVSNGGPGPAQGLVVSDTLPHGLDYVAGSAPGATYNPGARSLAWTMAELNAGQAITLSLAAGVAALPGEELTNQASLWARGLTHPLTVTAAVYVTEPGLIRPETGGVLRSLDGRVTVQFPPGAVDRAVMVSHSPVARPAGVPDAPFYQFELDARDTVSDQPVTTFGRNLTVTLAYTDSQVAGLNEASLRLVYRDEAKGEWVRLPSEVDLIHNVITATVNHFSLLAGEGDPAALVAETFKAYQTNLFAGSAIYGLDLQVPAGPGGLAPDLTLSYDSGAINTMLSWYSPGTWVGSGWNLNLGYVEFSEGTGEYNLILGGGSHKIVYDAQTGYHTVPEGFFKITRSGTGSKWWEIVAKDGTRYRFGQFLEQDTRYSGQGVTGSGSTLYYTQAGANNYCERHFVKWYLDEIQDTHGNKLGIVHQLPIGADVLASCTDNGTSRHYPREVYSFKILYSTNSVASPADNTAEYMVEFVLENRYPDGTDAHIPDGTLNYETKRLSEVIVWWTPTNPDMRIRRYDLTYHGDNDPAHAYPLALAGVQQYGLTDASPLPAISFQYSRDHLRYYVLGPVGCSYHPENGGEVTNRPLLTAVSNGYGGQLQIGYGVWNPCTPDHGGAAFSEPTQESGWTRHTVTAYNLSSGVAGDPGIQYSYAYVDGVQGNGQFIGFKETWTTDGLGNKSYASHYTHASNPDYVKNGKQELARQYQGASTLLQETANTWSTDSLWGDSEQDFVWLSSSVEKLYSGSLYQSKKTTYEYNIRWQSCGDTNPQNQKQYGNVTHVREYDSESASTPYRTTWTAYCPNTTDWIVDRTVFANVYEGDTSGTLKSSTWYVYGQAAEGPYWNLAPNSKGEMRGTRRYLGPGQFVDTRYSYDAWGNVTDVTAYNSYGDETHWASSNGQTTSTEYDGYHTFPVRVTNAAGHVTESQYYGVNETDGYGSGLPGQVKGTKDANLQWSWRQYDALGRLVYQWLPGDTVWNTSYASQAYSYNDATRRVYNRRRDDTGSSPTYLESWQFYDGLVRPIQSQAESATSGQSILTNQAYDAVGQVQKESLPYFYGAAGGTYRTPDWGKPYTSYTYDALGRAVRTTNPDGTWTEHHYGLSGMLWYDDVIDENRHLKGFLYDPFGQMVQVLEAVGTCGLWGYTCGQGETAWAISAQTSYGYDRLDNLVTVTDAASNVTTMAYNLLGRKTDMWDPDMGHWVYGYDTLGNLTSQKDAKNQTIYFTYDALNRMTLKDLPTGTDVHYYYDAGTWGKGRRTSMTDASGSTTWTYDLRGRLTQESKVINGSGTFVTQWDYDTMDRVKWTKYPAGSGGTVGEQVNTTYNTAGAVYSVAGSSTYVGTTTYNALGQFTRMTFGNGKETRRIYRSDNFRLLRIESGGTSDSNQQYLVYTYDNVGNVLSIADYDAGGTQTQSFTYDHLNRLVTAQASGGSGGTYSQESYGYSGNDGKIGNLTSKAGVAYTYEDAAHKHAVTHLNGVPKYWYDANGNMTTKVGSDMYTHTWDYENRLTEVKKNDEKVLLRRGPAGGDAAGQQHSVLAAGGSSGQHGHDGGQQRHLGGRAAVQGVG
jgi:uncharacterized repeat protein (TIGR01451 family)